jgi:ParB-like chromosome segregation protein Spo0J
MPKEEQGPELTVAMARRIELWPLDRLVPYNKNSRLHNADQVAQIAASIGEFGFTNPILVDSHDGIVAGHGRFAAAQELGLTTVPVVVLDHLSERQRKAYVIADNKLALNASWDVDMLAAELQDLRDDGFDLDLVGFTDAEIEGLMKDGWDSDMEAIDKIEEKDSSAKGKLTITFNEWDREQIREAVTNLIDSLGVEGVEVG